MSAPAGPSIVLAAGLRSPWAKAGGALRREDAGHLGAQVARELLARTGVDPATLDEVIAGSVGPPHDQANLGRVIALRAGVPREVPARTVARNCASGIEAVTQAVTEIRAGNGELYLCLGVEVMSAYPLIMGHKLTGFFERLMKARSLPAKLAAVASFRPSMLAPRVALLEGLRDPITDLLMGQTAEVLARDFGLSREACDRFATESHRRARLARDRGRFDREILPLAPLGAKPGADLLSRDDGIRDDQTVEALGRLKPYFEKPDGIVTVGNSCGITDGAAALLITTEERARDLGLQPLARIRSSAWAGLDPARMGLGPVFASKLALERAGCTLDDMKVVELNEAFAAQVLACREAFGSAAFAREHLGQDAALGDLDPERLNPNGGAIALGHPVGATGARLLLTVAHELHAGEHDLGLATLCIGGGQGGAVVLERLEGSQAS
jgi:acetyl-CoA acetyltransferase family protein